jgi:hypothetical protein
MAVNYSTALKNDRMQKVIDRIDAGAGAGILKIGTTGMAAVLAQLTLAKPSFGAPSNGVITLAGAPISDTAADGTGAAAAAQITDSTGTVIVDGLTVGTSGANINLNSTAIQVNQEVRINSGSLTHG